MHSHAGPTDDATPTSRRPTNQSVSNLLLKTSALGDCTVGNKSRNYLSRDWRRDESLVYQILNVFTVCRSASRGNQFRRQWSHYWLHFFPRTKFGVVVVVEPSIDLVVDLSHINHNVFAPTLKPRFSPTWLKILICRTVSGDLHAGRPIATWNQAAIATLSVAFRPFELGVWGGGGGGDRIDHQPQEWNTNWPSTQPVRRWGRLRAGSTRILCKRVSTRLSVS